MNRDEITLLMWRALGLVLLAAALLAVPAVLGGLLTLAEIALKAALHSAEFAKIPRQLVATQVSLALAKIGSFVILALLGRWVFRAPARLRRWMGE